jgi:hypothetical protein
VISQNKRLDYIAIDFSKNFERREDNKNTITKFVKKLEVLINLMIKI